MLPVRLAVVTGVAGMCLWGLFSLLETLKHPALLRTKKAAIVSGCDSLDSQDAQRLCPALLCMKAVLDAKLVGMNTPLASTVDKRNGAKQRLIAGTVGNLTGNDMQRFACVLDGPKVVAAKLLEGDEFDELVSQPGDWSLRTD